MSLTYEEIAELEALERYVGSLEPADPAETLARYCPHTPTPAQRRFLDLRHVREVLYGGAAGGGKSDALLMGALEYTDVPGYGALILRRTYPELLGADGLIQRAQDWLTGSGATWVASESCWVFPGGGKLFFGHCQHADDWRRYQGHALQYVGFDEGTHFLPGQYIGLLTRVRRPMAGPLSKVPLRVRMGTNPGGVSHDFVMRRWGLRVDGTQDEEQARNPETREVRAFVPAKLPDNPHLDVEAYRQQLSAVDATTRAQMEDGRWVRDRQGLVYRFDPERNIADRAPDGPGWHFLLAIDLGSSQAKPTCAFAVLAWSEYEPTVYCVRSWKEAGLIPSTIADRIADAASEWGIERVIVDQGALGSGYAREFALRFGEMIEPAQKRDKLGYRALLNGALERGELMLVRDQTEGLQAELGNLTWNAAGTDVEAGVDDHESDALLYGWRGCQGYAAEAPATRPAPGSPEWAAAEERRMIELAERHCRRESRSWLEQLEGDD